MRILEGGDEGRQGLPEFVNVLRGLREIVGEVDLRFTQLAQFVDGELEAVLVFVDEAFDLEEIILLEGFEDFFDVVPHFGFELAAAIAERESEVRLPGFLGLDLLANHDESRGDDFVLQSRAIADVKIFHGWSEYKGRVGSKGQRMPNFLCFFFPSFLASDSLAAAVSTGWVWLGLLPVST